LDCTTEVGDSLNRNTSVKVMEIKKAIEELRKGKKRKFVQTLDLIVNLKNFDVRKEALNSFVSVPHAGEKKLAGFLIKRSKLIDSITEMDFDKYKDLKNIKKLAKKYDAFIAVAPMMAKVATKFGRVLGPVGKMPSPQAGIISKDDDVMISGMIEKMNKSIRVRNKEMAVKLGVGNEGMSDDNLAENVEAVLSGLEKLLPRGKDNIREVLIKWTMSKPILIGETVGGREPGAEKTRNKSKVKKDHIKKNLGEEK